jgi:hypothetical protein
MAKKNAIRHEGDEAEEAFLARVPGSRKATRAKDGDVEVFVDDKPALLEIKKCHSESGGRGTLNQVRAIKFIPMVVYNPALGEWFVVPAVELVRMASSKARGQHTELSFESMNLSLSAVAQFKVHGANLAYAVHQAVRFDRENLVIGAAMTELLASLRFQAEKSKLEADRLLSTVPIWSL